MKATVVVDTIDKIKEFVNVAMSSKLETIDVKRGRFTVDARSIMGIFSLNVSEPVDVVVENGNDTDIEEFFNAIEKFVVK